MFIKNLSEFLGQEIEIKGWVYNLRSSGNIFFLQIRDGFGFTQAVVNKGSVPKQVWADCAKLSIESSVIIKGIVTQHPRKPDVFELQATALQIMQVAAE